jgi:hypothetical protein
MFGAVLACDSSARPAPQQLWSRRLERRGEGSSLFKRRIDEKETYAC